MLRGARGHATAEPEPERRLAISSVDRRESLYVPRFSNLGANDRDFLRGYGLQIELAPPSWIAISTFGEVLPRHDNRVHLDGDRRDAWGLRVPHIDMRYGENDRAPSDAMLPGPCF